MVILVNSSRPVGENPTFGNKEDFPQMCRFQLPYFSRLCLSLLSVLAIVTAPLFGQTETNPSTGRVFVQGAPKSERSESKEADSETEEPSPDEARQGLSLEVVQGVLESAQKLELPEEMKKQVIDALNSAVSFLQEARKYEEEAAKLNYEPKVIADKVKAKQEELSREPVKLEEFLKSYRVDANVSVEQLDEMIETLKQEKGKLEQKLAEQDKAWQDQKALLTFRKDRLEKNEGELTTVNQELKTLEEQLSKSPPENTPEPLVKAIKVRLQAEQKKKLEQRNYLSKEVPYYKATKELRELEEQALGKEVGELRRKIDALEKQLVELNKRKASLAVDELQRLINQTSEPLKPLAEEIAELARLREKQDGPLQTTSQLQENLAERTETLKFLQKEKTNTEARLKEDSRTETLARILNNQRNLIPSVYQYEEGEIRHRRMEIDFRSRKLDYESREQDLVDIEDELEEYVGSLSVTETQREALKSEARQLLQKKKETLATLKNDYDTLLSVLGELSKTEGDLVVLIKTYQDYLDEQSLWVPVAEVIQLRDLKSAHRALEPFLNVENWALLGETLGTEIMKSPIWAVLIVLLLVTVKAQTSAITTFG